MLQQLQKKKKKMAGNELTSFQNRSDKEIDKEL